MYEEGEKPQTKKKEKMRKKKKKIAQTVHQSNVIPYQQSNTIALQSLDIETIGMWLHILVAISKIR